MTKWISFKEQQPSLYKQVLIFYDDNTFNIGSLEEDGDGGFEWRDLGCCPSCVDNEVTYWQPLPEAPQ